MKITNAKLVSSDKRSRTIGGVYIEFTSVDNITKGTNVQLSFEESYQLMKKTK